MLLLKACHFEKEMVYRTIFKTYEDAKTVLIQFIEGLYNLIRIHSAIGYKTPQQMEDYLVSVA